MNLKIDHHYVGTIREAAWTTAQTGNVGLQLTLQCEDGEIDYIIWTTEKNREKAEREFAALDVSQDQLRDYDYVEKELLVDIIGHEVSFRIQEKEYKGKLKQQVAGIGRPIDASREVCKFFGGVPFEDADIPF